MRPYVISSFALATLGGKRPSPCSQANVERLRKLEHREGDSSYWSLENEFSFLRVGIRWQGGNNSAGIEALASSENTGDFGSADYREDCFFLLRNQDRYGIWYSTQATINVLDAMASLTSRKDNRFQSNLETRRTAESNAVVFRGREAGTLPLICHLPMF